MTDENDDDDDESSSVCSSYRIYAYIIEDGANVGFKVTKLSLNISQSPSNSTNISYYYLLVSEQEKSDFRFQLTQ